MEILYVFVVLVVIGVGNCYPAKNDSCDCVCGSPKNQRLNGDESFPLANKYPWTVGVYRAAHFAGFKCSGALISSKHILISQFCASLVKTSRDDWKEPIEIRLGDNANNTVSRGLFNIYAHENYTFEEPDNDIAILQLDQAVTFGFGIQSISLPVSQSIDYSGKLATATGWYNISPDIVKSEKAQRILNSQEIHVPIWTNEDCAKIPHYAEKLTNNMICAGEYENGVRYACITDLENDQIFIEREDGSMELVGIYTFGTRCGTVGVPAVYTRVSSFLPWIQSIIKNKSVPKNPI